MADKDTFKDRIAVDTKIHFGKSCVGGSRIPVENVLELVQESIAFDEIAQKYYPHLEVEDIKACVR